MDQRLDPRNQFGFPFESTYAIVLPPEPRGDEWTFERHRNTLMERIRELLPQDFEGPNREVGQSEYTWSNGVCILTLTGRRDNDEMDLALVAEYFEGVKGFWDLAKGIYNPLAAEYKLEKNIWFDEFTHVRTPFTLLK